MATRDYTSTSQDYMTPPELYQPLLDFMGLDKFTSDLACSNMNIPAEKYYTPDGLFSSEDFFFKISGQTGLDGNFGAGVHFLNPPFRETNAFLKVVTDEVSKNPDSRIWCILPSDRFETKYYNKFIVKNPNCFWVFLPKAGFLVPQQPLEKPKPSVKVMYCYFGKDAATTAKSFAELYGDKWGVVYNQFSC